MRNSRRIRLAAGFPVVVAVLLLVAGCSASAGGATSSNYVAVDRDDPAPTNTVIDPTGATIEQPADGKQPGEPHRDFDEIVAVFDRFLSLRAQAITGAIELDQLNSIASATALDQVARLRSANDELVAVDSYGALSSLVEWSNVSAVRQAGDKILFTDCTERQHVTPGGFNVITFVTNDVTVINVDGELKIDEVVETQDGIYAEPETFGCVPASFIERAETTAGIAVDAAARLIADPDGALKEGLPAVFAEEARSDLDAVLQSLSSQGLARIADEFTDIRVVGMDVNQAEFTVVVSVCRTYPTGRSFVDQSGVRTVADLPVGTSYEEWVYVHLEAVPVGTEATDRAVAVEDRGPNCQRG